MARDSFHEDHYAVLGVEPKATEADITKAYYSRAKTLHPDKSKHPDATRQFQRLAQAYETLKDKDKRRQYDNSRPDVKASRTATGYDSKYARTNTTQEPADNTSRYKAAEEAAEKRRAQHLKSQNYQAYVLNDRMRKLNLLNTQVQTLKAQIANEKTTSGWSFWSVIGMSSAETAEVRQQREEHHLYRQATIRIKTSRFEEARADARRQQAILKTFELQVAAEDQKLSEIRNARDQEAESRRARQQKQAQEFIAAERARKSREYQQKREAEERARRAAEEDEREQRERHRLKMDRLMREFLEEENLERVRRARQERARTFYADDDDFYQSM